MKQTIIISSKFPAKNIDWNKAQWLHKIDNKNVIVLSTGKHKADIFQGTILPCEQFPNGEVSIDLYKTSFTPLEQTLQIEISN